MKMADQCIPTLSTPLLLKQVRDVFDLIADHRQLKKRTISLADALMSGLAVFALKCPSLLKFDEQREEEHIRHNLQHLYGIDSAPCDTQLRAILDPVVPSALYPAYHVLFECVNRAGALERFRFLDGTFLLAVDGTTPFSSSTIHCDDCATKTTRSGERLSYHQLLAAAIIHPDLKQVLPVVPEPILGGDGETKNDCELSASKRLLPRVHQDHPGLRFTVVEDALFANGPHIKLLKEIGFSFLIGVKEGDHAHLFKAVQAHEVNETMGGLIQHDEKQHLVRIYRFVNDLELNQSHAEIKVNFLEYIELKHGEAVNRFTWVTDFMVTEENCIELVRGGRARWKIENETFNTLKNQGYRLEHNYGHGKQHLSTNFALLMMLAFFIDQIQELAYVPFQKARQRFRSRTSLWERMRALFVGYFIDDWETFWQAIIHGHQVGRLRPKHAEIDNSS
jgi:hypothetical protein